MQVALPKAAVDYCGLLSALHKFLSLQSTAETVRQLQQRHASQLADCQRQLQLLTALAQPEPCPKPWQLNLRTEACKYFLTELETDPTTAAGAAQGLGDAGSGFDGGAAGPPKPKVFVAGLGLGPEIPRFLRWDEPVEVHDVSLQDLEQQVAEVWQAKAAYEAAHGPCCLQTFLHEHLRALAVYSRAEPTAADAAPQAAPQAAAAAAAAARAPLEPVAAAAAACADAVDAAEQAPLCGAAAAAGSHSGEPDPAASCDTSSTGGCSSSSSTGSQQAVGAAQAAGSCSGQNSMAGTAAAASAAAAAAGYQLYYACCTLWHDSVALELLWLVLTGQLPEVMLLQQQQRLQAVVTVLQKLAAAPAGAVKEGLSDATAGQSVAGASAAFQAATTSSSSSAAMPWSKVVTSLQALFPGKSSAHQQQLAAWLAAACGLPTTTSSSGSSDEGRPEQQVAASTLAALSSTIQRELFCRFGSSSSSASSNSSSSVGAPEVAAGLQQAVVSDAAGAGSGVSAAALRQLIEGLLRQHLQLMLTHNQEVAQHVWQQLQQAPAPAAPAQGLGGVGGWPHAEDPVWQQVAQYLQAQGGGCDVLPHLQAAARSGSRAGGEAVVRRCLLIPPECKVDLAAALIVACE